MKPPHPLAPAALAAALLLGLFAVPASRAVEGAEGITAVSSQASKDYVRERLPDGAFKPEGYAFGRGGSYGGPFPDATIDSLEFRDIAHVIAAPLAARGYLPSMDPDKTRLLIMVYWGTTVVPDPDPAHEPNVVRDRLDRQNAALLGYDADGLIGTEYAAGLELTALRQRARDQRTEIEFNRYFVVLMAYDFQLLWHHKQHKLLWETRFSLNQRDNNFTKALPVMAHYASRYFGEDSGGLVRTAVPRGHVDIGLPTVIEDK